VGCHYSSQGVAGVREFWVCGLRKQEAIRLMWLEPFALKVIEAQAVQLAFTGMSRSHSASAQLVSSFALGLFRPSSAFLPNARLFLATHERKPSLQLSRKVGILSGDVHRLA
jgi:hypothetical protein